MLQPKNVHQLLRNQNSGVPCGTFSSTTTMTTKINSKWGPKRKIYQLWQGKVVLTNRFPNLIIFKHKNIQAFFFFTEQPNKEFFKWGVDFMPHSDLYMLASSYYGPIILQSLIIYLKQSKEKQNPGGQPSPASTGIDTYSFLSHLHLLPNHSQE